MINKLNILISSFVTALILATPKASYGSDKIEIENPHSAVSFGILPKEVGDIIVKEAAVQLAFNYKFADNLSCVNKTWNNAIEGLKQEVKNPVWKLLQGVTDANDEATYQTFLNGMLVYRLTPGSDMGKIEFKISDFLNPFKGTFDLSKCGNAAKYMTITTDPFVFFQVNKEHPTLRILISPYFLIKRYISFSAKFLDPIMKDWNKAVAPVGIFWRWSAWESLSSYDYLSSAPVSEIGSRNLYKNWQAAYAAWAWVENRLCMGTVPVTASKTFHVYL